MIGKLVSWALSNRLLVMFGLVVLVGAGVKAMLDLPLDAVPDVTNEQVQVLTSVPGLSPLEVERFITFPVEAAMSGIPKVTDIRSVSKFGLSAITVVFEEGTDIYWARQQVSERLSTAEEMIPPGYGSPELGPISTGLGEIYQFEVRGEPMCGPGAPDTPECWTLMELRTLLDWDIAYRLRSVPGIVEVNTFGGEAKRYEVRVHPDRLFAYGLGIADVMEALKRNNLATGGGYIEHAGEQRIIRGEALLTGIEDIRNVVLRTDEQGTPVTVGMVAEVALGAVTRQGAVTRDGRGEVVLGITMMLKGANSRIVAKNVDDAIQEISRTLPAGVTIDTFYDRTELVNRTVHTVVKNLAEGAVLVVLVVILVLGNVRAGLIVAAAIPFSMLFAFMLMARFGISANLMSLGAIDFGLLVDGSIVIIENVLRRLERRDSAASPLMTIREAAVEVGRSVAFSVGIIIMVYLPIVTLQGVEGRMFRPMALTVAFALFGSLLVALLVSPVLATFFLTSTKESKETWLMRWAERLYRPVLTRAQAHPFVVVTGATLLLVASLFVFGSLGTAFIPRLDEGSIALQAWRLPSVGLQQGTRDTTLIEKTLLAEFPDEVSTVVSKTGRAEIATDPMGVDVSDVFVMLQPKKGWKAAATKEELIGKMDAALNRAVPGVKFSFSQPIELRVQELIAGVRSDLAIKVFGDDLGQLGEVAEQVARVVNAVPGAADVKVEQVAGLPNITVTVDRPQAARYGVDAESILAVVQAARAGVDVGVVIEGQPRFPLAVTLPPGTVREVGDIRTLPVASRSGSLVPLGQVARVREEEGVNQISREAISRRITVEANVRGRDLGSFVADAQKAVADRVQLPSGYHLTWGGQFENLQRATARLRIVVPVTLAIIFVFLYLTFKSVRLAALIYLNVPLAVIGGVFSLYARGLPFTISAGVGFIALSGIAVLNGVVVVAHIRDLRRRGLPSREAAHQGVLDRLRMVITTALVAAFGFVPMAIATSAGAEVQHPLATVVIGGIITATFLTLVVLPAVYPWFDPPETEF
ncbi:MAG: efflux RND transporter permease subunit [Acidobacteria bacterium]|nr:efflux RND transporter permease subunit [Acidobacteriota bacterium]